MITDKELAMTTIRKDARAFMYVSEGLQQCPEVCACVFKNKESLGMKWLVSSVVMSDPVFLTEVAQIYKKSYITPCNV